MIALWVFGRARKRICVGASYVATILRSPARLPQLQSLTGFWSLKRTVEQTSLNKTNSPHHSKKVKLTLRLDN